MKKQQFKYTRFSLKDNCFGDCLTWILREKKQIDLRVSDEYADRREKQLALLDKELEKRGLTKLVIDVRDETVHRAINWSLDTEFIALGNHRTGSHAVVVKDNRIVFDPAGKQSLLMWPYSVIFILH